MSDHHVPPGVLTEMGEGDDRPRLHDELLSADILIIATPTWLGCPSSIAQRVLERMDAMLSETDANGRPVADNRVAGVTIPGVDNEQNGGAPSGVCPSTRRAYPAHRAFDPV